jgi:hypothetical protein
LIDRDAERQSNLLSDSGAVPGGIALLGGDDRVPEFWGGQNSIGLKVIDYSAGSLQTVNHDRDIAMARNSD